MAERFYVNSPLASGQVVLQGAEAHHLAVVCRLRPGDRVCLFNGDGHEYSAEIVAVERKNVALQVQTVETPDRELGFRLLVAAPLPKGDRAQFLLEKLTEVGVTQFIPLRTQHTVVYPGQVRREKIERYVIEASKQCRRNVLMQVDELTDWRDLCGRADLPAARILAHPGAPVPANAITGDVICAVGPEGGFTGEEAAQGCAAGWLLVGLGPRILRIETAALALAITAASAAPRSGRSA